LGALLNGKIIFLEGPDLDFEKNLGLKKINLGLKIKNLLLLNT